MKKGLLALAAIFCICSMFAFSQGSANLGGTASFSSFKADSDDDASTTFTFRPQLGYFPLEDLCLDISLQNTFSRVGTV